MAAASGPHAVKIGEAITLTSVAKIIVDQGHALVEIRNWSCGMVAPRLGHGIYFYWEFRQTLSKSCRIGKPALMITSKKYIYCEKTIF
jgi:hypothetical protein